MQHLSIALVLLALLAAPVHAQTPRDEIRAALRRSADTLRTVSYQRGLQEQTDRQTRTVRIGADGELTLGNVSGDIVVTRGGGNDATIEIVKTARARTAEEARELLGLVTVSVSERGSRAEVRTVYPQDDRRNNRRSGNVSVAYNVSAPASTRVMIGSVSGSIGVSGIKGDLAVNSVSGGVRIANAGRISSAKSVSGEVEIVETQTDGAVEVESVSGSVLLRKVTARRVDAGSVSGSVTLQDVQCDRVEAHSVSGSVEFSGVLATGGRYQLNSHSGDVRIAVGGSTGFEVEANSFSGSVRSDLPLSLQAGRGDRRESRRTLRGVFGDGSAVLEVTTFSGSVVITKR